MENIDFERIWEIVKMVGIGLLLLGVLAIKFNVESMVMFTVIFAQVNMVLFCINIAPVPGFDGGTVLMELIGGEKLYSSELGKGFMIGSFLLLFYLMDYIFAWASWATAHLLNFLGNLLI